MNMGGPETLKEVQPFLHNLFSDGDLIPLPMQSMLAPWIARRRTPQIQDQYAKIGGGSPIKHWTRRQGLLLEQLMDKISPKTGPHKSYVAFRYAEPLTEVALDQMKQDGVTNAVALSLYPQYSCSTTGSSLNQIWRKLKVLDPEGSIKWSVIDRWPTNELLVEVCSVSPWMKRADAMKTFARHIEASLKEYPESERKDVVLLFSAHSLPMSVVNRGDTYPGEVAATVNAVMQRLGHKNPYRLVWQSQVGPSAWLGPQTSHAIEGYGKQSKHAKKNLLLIPIAFVSDHIETLFELDVEYGHLAEKVCGLFPSGNA
ncbi:ferrochelatase hem15 [Irineochytrium annulatum]|nr:ferrochelatase hem15 [Irineochytrium annulatum]